ncbi:hypothetical protein ACA544_18095 [Vibrio cholerae]|uniref:hypothetical protein n=1 Tax=Vibrio cholerae TaxID=666 RepID=UPI001A2E393D|nr:hypothetical protein [Vibrio cholerae]
MMRTDRFIIQIFNVPSGIKESDLKITHSNLDDWELMDVATDKGKEVANITLATKTTTTSTELKSGLAVSSSIHQIDESDIILAAW